MRLYRRKVFNVAYKFVGRHDQAEDLTQDVFLKLFKSLDTFDRRANFQTWLISVSRNLCIDHYRSRPQGARDDQSRRRSRGLRAGARRTRAPTRSSNSATACACCAQALDKLAPTLRTAVMLRDIQELTYQEIADKLRPARKAPSSRASIAAGPSWRGRFRKLREQQDAIPRTGVSG